jgi:hypothetical protein
MMFYSAEVLEILERQQGEVISSLNDLQIKIVREGQTLDHASRVREHLLHGAGRRVGVIRRSIENVFSLFPPNTTRPLGRDALADVQINLHAFVMNLYGLYDNWAWAYVLRHNLELVIGDRRRVGLFLDATRSHLPAQLRTYLDSPMTTEWHESYAKSCRDALAHRIPPYIPPAEFTPEEGRRFNELETQKLECISNENWERLEQVSAEQSELGRPSFTFLHAFTEDTPPRPLILHPQLLTDGMAIAEFGHLFLQHWHEVT